MVVFSIFKIKDSGVGKVNVKVINKEKIMEIL